jgi:hypothetical protein
MRMIATLAPIRIVMVSAIAIVATVAFRPGEPDFDLEDYAASMRLLPDDTDDRELSRQEAIEMARHSGLRPWTERTICVGVLGRVADE